MVSVQRETKSGAFSNSFGLKTSVVENLRFDGLVKTSRFSDSFGVAVDEAQPVSSRARNPTNYGGLSEVKFLTTPTKSHRSSNFFI